MEECLCYTAAGDKGHCSEAGKFSFSYGTGVGGFRTCGLPSGSTCRGVSGRLPDKIIKGYSLVIASTPSFWLALLLLIIFGVWMKILPIGLSVPIGVEASGVTFLDRVRHAILPAVTFKHNRNFEYHITYQGKK